MFPQSNIQNKEKCLKAAFVILFIMFNNGNTKKYF